MGTMTPEHPSSLCLNRTAYGQCPVTLLLLYIGVIVVGAQSDCFLNSHALGLRKCTGIIVFKERSVGRITRSESETLSSLDPKLV